MNFWKYIKLSLNSTLATNTEQSLDKMINPDEAILSGTDSSPIMYYFAVNSQIPIVTKKFKSYANGNIYLIKANADVYIVQTKKDGSQTEISINRDNFLLDINKDDIISITVTAYDDNFGSCEIRAEETMKRTRIRQI